MHAAYVRTGVKELPEAISGDLVSATSNMPMVQPKFFDKTCQSRSNDEHHNVGGELSPWERYLLKVRDYTVSRFRLGSLLVTHVCSVVSLGELPTASPP